MQVFYGFIWIKRRKRPYGVKEGGEGERETRMRLLRKERVRCSEGVVLCVLILCLPSAESLFRLLLRRQPWNVSVPKNHIPTQEGFLREAQRRRRRSGRRKSAVANAHYQAGQLERRESQRAWLIHRATLAARPWHWLLCYSAPRSHSHPIIRVSTWFSIQTINLFLTF